MNTRLFTIVVNKTLGIIYIVIIIEKNERFLLWLSIVYMSYSTLRERMLADNLMVYDCLILFEIFYSKLEDLLKEGEQ